jgi:hypothetical protein
MPRDPPDPVRDAPRALTAAFGGWRTPAAIPVHQPERPPSSSTSICSQGTDPKPVGVMLSPKIGVMVIVYSPSEGNR